MKTLITFFESFMINWPIIWSDTSIYICLWIIALYLITVWAAKNYRNSVREEYLVKTTSKLCALNDEIDKQKSEYKFLDKAFAEYRIDAQNEAFERQTKINDLKAQNTALRAEVEQLSKDRYNLQCENAELTAENIMLRTQLQGRRNPDGRFAKTTGKGHGRKKPASIQTVAPEPERDWTTATPDELLAEAKRRYPVGTKYADVLDSVEYESECEPWIYTYAKTFKGIAICVTDGGGFVYAKNQWAQILP